MQEDCLDVGVDIMRQDISRREFVMTTAAAATMMTPTAANLAADRAGMTKAKNRMRIGLYTITYLGIWYKGDAMKLPALMRFAKKVRAIPQAKFSGALFN